MRKAGRPGGRKALQAPGKRRAQEQVKNVGREYKTSAFLNTYQKPYEVALTPRECGRKTLNFHPPRISPAPLLIS